MGCQCLEVGKTLPYPTGHSSRVHVWCKGSKVIIALTQMVRHKHHTENKEKKSSTKHHIWSQTIVSTPCSTTIPPSREQARVATWTAIVHGTYTVRIAEMKQGGVATRYRKLVADNSPENSTFL